MSLFTDSLQTLTEVDLLVPTDTRADFSTQSTTGMILKGAANAAAADIPTVVNASFGQASTLTIPDPGAATASFLLSTGTNNIITDFQMFVPAISGVAFSAGTWTLTRNAASDYAQVHTAAANSPIVSLDITDQIRLGASKGFELTSIDVVTKVGTLALTSATPSLNQVTYVNNVAVAVTNVPVTGSLSTATQTNPYVDNLAVTTPAFLNTAVSKYNLEITYVCQATTALAFYGINLHFSQTVA